MMIKESLNLPVNASVIINSFTNCAKKYLEKNMTEGTGILTSIIYNEASSRFKAQKNITTCKLANEEHIKYKETIL